MQDQRKFLSSQLVNRYVAFVVVEKEVTLETSVYAESVSEKWPLVEKFLVYKKPVDNLNQSIKKNIL